MSRAISRYPGNVPRASFINYEDPSLIGPVPFIISGDQFQTNMEVSFWDLQNDCEIMGAGALALEEVKTGEFAGSEQTIQGKVTLPGPGMYQVVLKNPNIRKSAQPLWIYWKGLVCAASSPNTPGKKKGS